MKGFRKGGIHPSPMKYTSGSEIKNLCLPELLYIPLSQHIGREAISLVKAGDEVEALQMIAKADGFISANIHSPVAGKVVKLDSIPDSQGNPIKVIVLKPAEDSIFPLPENGVRRTDEEVAALTPDEIRNAVAQAGVVGMGGAAFPTAVKLSPPEGTSVDTVILNGAECEPCLTCDDALMRIHAREILLGGILLMKAVGASRLLVGIEANKPEAIAAMKEAAAITGYAEIIPLRVKYPQGGEKQLIEALTGREVPSGKLPADAGAVVDNVATAYAVYEAVYCSRPLVQRVITISAPSTGSGGNYLIPIGISYTDLIEESGLQLPEGEIKIIAGGPMMGRAVNRAAAPAVKAFSGLTCLPAEMAYRNKEQHCIRCANCVDVCPMRLEPFYLYQLSKASRWEDMAREAVMNCIECGSCQWKCPSSKPLLDYIRLGKNQLRKIKR